MCVARMLLEIFLVSSVPFVVTCPVKSDIGNVTMFTDEG